jgi:ornithine lipid hydroxylase
MTRVLTWTLQRLAWPTLTCGAALATWVALRHGVPLPAIAIGLTLVVVLLTFALERAIPYSREWSTFGADERTDRWHFALTERLYDAGALLSLALFVPLGERVAQAGLALWPHAAPLALQVALALLVTDVSLYAMHRLSHRVPWLWRLHANHHAAPRLHWLSVWRSHPLDNLVRSVANVAPLAFLGAPAEALALASAFAGTSVILTHCNADLRTGWLDGLFTTPTVHRWHHSRELRESDANFGITLQLWDWLFGTRCPPVDREAQVVVGWKDAPAGYPTSFRGQLLAPFR